MAHELVGGGSVKVQVSGRAGGRRGQKGLQPHDTVHVELPHRRLDADSDIAGGGLDGHLVTALVKPDITGAGVHVDGPVGRGARRPEIDLRV